MSRCSNISCITQLELNLHLGDAFCFSKMKLIVLQSDAVILAMIAVHFVMYKFEQWNGFFDGVSFHCLTDSVRLEFFYAE